MYVVGLSRTKDMISDAIWEENRWQAFEKRVRPDGYRTPVLDNPVYETKK